MKHKMRSSLILIYLMCFLLCRTPNANTLTPQEIAKKALDATVQLEKFHASGQNVGIGSGFFVRSNHIATSFHVIDGFTASKLRAKLVNQKKVYLIESIRAVDEKHDLAILKVSAPGVKPLLLGDSDAVEIGDTVYVVGNPQGLEGTFSDGKISAIRKRLPGGAGKRIQYTAQTSKGSSGGPAVNIKGEVIGVHAEGWRDKVSDDTEKFNFAIPSNYLKDLINRRLVPAKPVTPKVTIAQGQGDGASRFDKAIAQYQKVLDENPTSVDAHLNLGLAYVSFGAMDEAAVTFEGALRLDANDTAAYFCLGATYLRQQDYENAITVFEKAIRYFPDWAQAYAQLGMAWFRQHDYDKAEAEWKKAFALMTSSKSPSYRLAPSSVVQQAYHMNPLTPGGVSYFLGRIAFEYGRVDQANAYYRQSIRLEPSLAEAHFRLGLVHVRKKQEDKAEHAFNEAIRLDPQMTSAYYRLSLLHFKQGKKAEAEQEMEKFRQLREDQVDEVAVLRASQGTEKAAALSNLGWKYIHEKKLEAALQQFNQALWHDSNIAAVHNGLGYIYSTRGQLEEALEAQQRAVKLKPDMASAHSGLGLVWLKKAQASDRREDYEKAISAYRRAAELKPDSPQTWLNIGSIAIELDRIQEAQTAYEKLLALEPNRIPIRLRLAQVYFQQGNFERAVNHYQEVIKHDPHLAEPHYRLGLIALEEDQIDAAVNSLNAAVKLQPDMFEAHYYLGRIYLSQNQVDAAVDSLNTAVRLQPDMYEVHHYLGVIYSRQNHVGLSEQAYQRAIDLNPNFDPAYERLAHLYGTHNTQLQKALEFAERAVELRPDSARYLNTLSWLYYRNNDYAKAEGAIQKALTLQPKNRTYQEGLKAIQKARQGQNQE